MIFPSHPLEHHMTAKNSKSSQRERRRAEQARQQRLTRLASGLVVVLVAAFLIYAILRAIGNPPLGNEITTTGSGSHVRDGQPIPEYSTNPPTSGTHYDTPLPEGFYDTNSREAIALTNPQAHIVHSMEHGYVVFWYNCTLLAEAECAELKNQISQKLADYNNYKIIAFPWSFTSVPIVATSWGRMLEMPAWDDDLASQFIERNRNHAPESNAR
jgi:hypothetical protein